MKKLHFWGVGQKEKRLTYWLKLSRPLQTFCTQKKKQNRTNSIQNLYRLDSQKSRRTLLERDYGARRSPAKAEMQERNT
jgi:hypothetical protein